ncbi:unnamed protein product [Cyprideis torosa]|uniref:Uncharacterized protein n=1 Tax=Cyprideis torosa TaxID=163714 RepID=A0A7R8WHQ2_9CRUS|nr:unnamed protein product [Cyprideis torosa]CAG0893514.1 unnamed protein product [Cyprideis torosa]
MFCRKHAAEKEANLKKQTAEKEANLKKQTAEKEMNLKKHTAEKEVNLKKQTAEKEANLKKQTAEKEANLKKQTAEKEVNLKKQTAEKEVNLKKQTAEKETNLKKQTAEKEVNLKKQTAEKEANLKKHTAEKETNLKTAEKETNLKKQTAEKEANLKKQTAEKAPLLQPPTSLPLGLLNGLPSAGESLASSDCTTDLSDPTTGFVTIRITPDEQGRFGFNVRGGVDQNKPVIVSRVAPNMAADRSYPRLNEGDQVLFINGRDISGHTHDQVVSFIRSSTLQGILELIVKPSAAPTDPRAPCVMGDRRQATDPPRGGFYFFTANQSRKGLKDYVLNHLRTSDYVPADVMYVGDDSFWDGGGEEPEFSYVPLIGQGGDKEGRSPGSPPQPTPYRNILRSLLASNGQAVGQTTGARALAESMLILAEGIEDGSVIRAFETLYRRKPGMRSDQCKAMDNLVKNRYRDICPYDDTRVTLRNPPEAQNDYINANHITIEVPDSVPPANYIGCQAPLPNTMGDFWTMAFENSCPLIMMVTVIAERGRVKSHKYWPNQGDTLSFPNGLSVTCKRETDMGAMTIRDFLMVMDNKEEKSIIQIMFKTWPDHGVPESPKDFLNMVYHMRKIKGMNANPVIVHCSAGIGRTGVLILMDVALSMIDAKIPVYPVEIVETMREQRALLVQTSIQFRFCCEAILRVYTDGELKYRP